jgi:hypothetical protein
MPSDNGAAAVIAALIAAICVICWRAALRLAIIATAALAIYGGTQLAQRLASHSWPDRTAEQVRAEPCRSDPASTTALDRCCSSARYSHDSTGQLL